MNEEKKHIFNISIDDGTVEWQYPIKLSANLSIENIMDEICKTFKAEKEEPIFRGMKEPAKCKICNTPPILEIIDSEDHKHYEYICKECDIVVARLDQYEAIGIWNSLMQKESGSKKIIDALNNSILYRGRIESFDRDVAVFPEEVYLNL